MSLSIDDMTVSTIVSEYFRLDGGAMFGAVPRVLWERKISTDDRHRIPMCSRVLLIRRGDRTILVDLGCGNNLTQKELAMFAIEQQFKQPLAERYPEVTDVILTHLHFDHAAGVCLRTSTGELRLSFPNATHYLQKRHWEYAQAPHLRERSAFRADTISSLKSAKLQLLDGPQELFPGIHVIPSHGHTPGLQYVEIRGKTETLVFPCDVVPTAHHIPVSWVMGFDQCAETTCNEKFVLLDRAARENSILVFSHDRETEAARVRLADTGKFEISETLSLRGA